MAHKVVLKKYKNSFRIILPEELIKKENLKEGDRIFIEIIK